MIRYTAYRKYLYYLKNYSSFKKVNNILLNNREFYLKKTTLKSLPYQITIDPASHCNLRCPACHTGTKFSEMVKPSFLKFKDFQTILNQVKDHTLSIALYNWGEPFLNKEIFDIISFATENKVGTTMHSNFNHFNEKMADNLVRSGLTHLYLSIDGATQEVYEQYRVKGKLNNVLHNIQLLNDAKKKHNSQLPFITWKYLKFAHNEHEILDAHKIAKTLNVNNFEVFAAQPVLRDIYDEAKEYELNPGKLQQLKHDCKSLWASLYITPDGTTFPCSLSFRPSESFGNILNEDLSNIWNNISYRNARSLFTPGFSKGDVPLPCKGCKFYLRNCAKN
ncbi:MAG: radical SAM protein [Bacteroidota bacterium]|nr:radical SAM protein [Bacteroidota bacterium]